MAGEMCCHVTSIISIQLISYIHTCIHRLIIVDLMAGG